MNRYDTGRFSVRGPNGVTLGCIDGDEFVRNGSSLVYRIDGAEVYTLNGSILAFIDSGVARTPSGDIIFTIHPE